MTTYSRCRPTENQWVFLATPRLVLTQHRAAAAVFTHLFEKVWSMLKLVCMHVRVSDGKPSQKTQNHWLKQEALCTPPCKPCVCRFYIVYLLKLCFTHPSCPIILSSVDIFDASQRTKAWEQSSPLQRHIVKHSVERLNCGCQLEMNCIDGGRWCSNRDLLKHSHMHGRVPTNTHRMLYPFCPFSP